MSLGLEEAPSHVPIERLVDLRDLSLDLGLPPALVAAGFDDQLLAVLLGAGLLDGIDEHLRIGEVLLEAPVTCNVAGKFFDAVLASETRHLGVLLGFVFELLEFGELLLVRLEVGAYLEDGQRLVTHPLIAFGITGQGFAGLLETGQADVTQLLLFSVLGDLVDGSERAGAVVTELLEERLSVSLLESALVGHVRVGEVELESGPRRLELLKVLWGHARGHRREEVRPGLEVGRPGGRGHEALLHEAGDLGGGEDARAAVKRLYPHTAGSRELADDRRLVLLKDPDVLLEGDRHPDSEVSAADLPGPAQDLLGTEQSSHLVIDFLRVGIGPAHTHHVRGRRVLKGSDVRLGEILGHCLALRGRLACHRDPDLVVHQAAHDFLTRSHLALQGGQVLRCLTAQMHTGFGEPLALLVSEGGQVLFVHHGIHVDLFLVP